MPQVDFTLEDVRVMMTGMMAEMMDERFAQERVYTREIMQEMLDKTADRLDVRIDRLEHKMDRRFGVLEFRMDRIEARFDTLTADLDEHFQAVQADYSDLHRRTTRLEQQM